MRRPTDPVRRSVASGGNIADRPDEITVVKVKDEDGDTVGVFIQWSTTEWVWADISSFEEGEDFI